MGLIPIGAYHRINKRNNDLFGKIEYITIQRKLRLNREIRYLFNGNEY